jgi:hypothetical protein
MKKLLLLSVMVLAFNFASYADTGAISTFQEGSTGTTSATVVIRPSEGSAHVTDIIYKLDSTLTTGTISVYPGKARFLVTSATASGTTLWFDNSSSAVAAGDFVILSDVSTVNNYLYRTTAVTTTSVTINSSITAATTTSDIVYSTRGRFVRHAPTINTSQTFPSVSVWLPSGVPSAIAVDGNTTACSIFVSGVRTRDSN